MRNSILTILLVFLASVSYSQIVFIKMTVDMNNYGPAFTTVYVGGTINGFCGTCSPLADPDLDGVWSAVLPVDISTVTNWPEVEWKFQVDNWTDQENFPGGEPCTKTSFGFTNRVANFPNLMAGDTACLDTFCWEACVTCDLAPAQHEVKFCVDMSDYVPYSTVVAQGVNVNGLFNGFCGTCWPLTDADGDSIWCGTYTVTGDTTEYLFTVGNYVDLEDFDVGEPCTKTTFSPPDTFVNRYLVLSPGDTCLDTVCWNSCFGCDGPPSACPTPTNPVGTATGSKTATLTWDDVPEAVNYTVQGSLVGFAPITINHPTNSLNVSGLEEGKCYWWQVKANCANEMSSYSVIDTFCTCGPPGNLNESNITPSSALLDWDPVPAAASYVLVGRQINPNGPIVQLNVGQATSLNATGLSTCQSYAWSVYVNCTSGGATDIAPASFFSTTGCKTGTLDEIGFAVFPNPAENSLTINVAQSGDYMIELSDLQGRLVKQLNSSLDNTITIDVSTVTSGMYILRLTGNEIELNEKIVIK